jgi:hypothetical protein
MCALDLPDSQEHGDTLRIDSLSAALEPFKCGFHYTVSPLLHRGQQAAILGVNNQLAGMVENEKVTRLTEFLLPIAAKGLLRQEIDRTGQYCDKLPT